MDNLSFSEQCFYLEDIESAKRCYDDAILSAQEHKFVLVHEEALACELAGHFMLESGEGLTSFHFLVAQKKSTVNGKYLCSCFTFT